MTHRQTATDAEPTLPKSAAAEAIGVSLRTLERYVADGRIAPLPFPLRPRTFAVADIEKLKRTGNAVTS